MIKEMIRNQLERIGAIFLFFVYFSIVAICFIPQMFYDVRPIRRIPQQFVEIETDSQQQSKSDIQVIRDLELLTKFPQIPLVA